jgi:hypothetical protein
MTWLRNKFAESNLIPSFVYLVKILAVDMALVRCSYQEAAHGCCRSNADQMILCRVPRLYAPIL